MIIPYIGYEYKPTHIVSPNFFSFFENRHPLFASLFSPSCQVGLEPLLESTFLYVETMGVAFLSEKM